MQLCGQVLELLHSCEVTGKKKKKHLFEIKLLGKNSHASLLPHWLDTAQTLSLWYTLQNPVCWFSPVWPLLPAHKGLQYICSKHPSEATGFQRYILSNLFHRYSAVKPVVLLHNPEPRFWSGFGHKHRVMVLAAKSVHCSHRCQDSSLFTVNVR